MFEFLEKHGHEDGSEKRFDQRVESAKKQKRTWSHHFWWFVHNCVAHPLIGICPAKWAFNFHDWTARRMSARVRAEEQMIKQEKQIKQWMEDRATEFFESPNGDMRLAEAAAIEFGLYENQGHPSFEGKIQSWVYDLVEEVRMWWKDQ